VFITDRAEDLLPRYLRFLRGVVDSEDLPLNVSREMLQHNRVLGLIRAGVVKRVLSELEKKAKDDASDYASFWSNFGPVLKEGLYEDAEHRDTLLSLARFRTTGKPDDWTGLADYADRTRALEKMRRYFAGRGVAVPGGSFVTAIGTFESVTAPATLADVAAKCALNANLLSPLGSQLVQAATKSLFVAKVQLMGTAAAAAVIAVTATITALETPRQSVEPASPGKRTEVMERASAGTPASPGGPAALVARPTESKSQPAAPTALASATRPSQRPIPFSAAMIVKQELSPGPAGMRSKLEDITLHKVQFRDTRLPDALKLLERQIRAADPTGTGVPLFGAGKEDTKITLTLHQVPALEVVKYLTNLSGSDYRITEFGVELRPVGKN
jgi:hypothetical protein